MDLICPTTAAGLRAMCAARLLATPSEAIFDPRSGGAFGPSDFDLNPEMVADFAVMDAPRPAAVLIPIVARAPLSVLFTLRTAHLSSHAGQIAFPGGRVDPEDASIADAALREADEEIGLKRRHIEPLGFIDSYRTGTGYQISPLVALVKPEFTLTLNPEEVAEVFEVPFAYLMDQTNHQRHSRDWRGRVRSFYAMPYGERYIWGATAGMLKNLHQRLSA